MTINKQIHISWTDYSNMYIILWLELKR